MNRPFPSAILLSGLAIGLAGCGGDDKNAVEPPHEGGGTESGNILPKKGEGGPRAGLGPVAPTAPVEPSPIPAMPTNPRGEMDKPDATRPGGLPSEDSKKEGARPPEAGPGAPPAAPK